tara:strand:- start:2102 stop:2269 length:168 start_codon:yes stop_codon:yes gene_type:complete
VQNQQVGTSQRDLKCYQLTKDGFMFLVMGFTGAKAAALNTSLSGSACCLHWKAAK